eukprot:2333583-Pleurochrysis_carterae.AAC.2
MRYCTTEHKVLYHTRGGATWEIFACGATATRLRVRYFLQHRREDDRGVRRAAVTARKQCPQLCSNAVGTLACTEAACAPSVGAQTGAPEGMLHVRGCGAVRFGAVRCGAFLCSLVRSLVRASARRSACVIVPAKVHRRVYDCLRCTSAACGCE